MSVPEPYWADKTCTLYLGDSREVVPALGVTADCILTDPSYEETSLEWDRWADGWLEVAASVSRSMWCFGSLRMFGERWGEFTAAKWKLSHEAECEWLDHVAWEKHNGSGFARDRFKKVHELAGHFYRGPWRDIYKDMPREQANRRISVPDQGADRAAHAGSIRNGRYTDDGTRLMRSVIRCHSMHGAAIHPTQKPVGVLSPLIEYACPPGGLVLDMHAGSGSALMAARMSGRRAIGIEGREDYAERAALWLSQLVLEAS